MPVELKQFNYKISIALLLLILNNYLLQSIGLFNIFLKINLIFFFFLIGYFYFKYLTNNLILKIYFVLILLISLGTPAEGWDLRSLYLFHAKRIFLINRFIQWLITTLFLVIMIIHYYCRHFLLLSQN